MFFVSKFANLFQDEIKARKASDGSRQECDEVALAGAGVGR